MTLLGRAFPKLWLASDIVAWVMVTADSILTCNHTLRHSAEAFTHQKVARPVSQRNIAAAVSVVYLLHRYLV